MTSRAADWGELRGAIAGAVVLPGAPTYLAYFLLGPGQEPEISFPDGEASPHRLEDGEPSRAL
jgi:hypothetical protein